MPHFDCLRCGTAMQFVGQHKLQLGRTSWIFGDLPNLMAGALDVSIMACPACGKLEFFTGGVSQPSGNDPGLHQRGRAEGGDEDVSTSADARNAALPTISTTPNVPCAAMSTPPGTSCKNI